MIFLYRLILVNSNVVFPFLLSQPETMSLMDVNAAVSVLLGFAPPALSADSSSKVYKWWKITCLGYSLFIMFRGDLHDYTFFLAVEWSSHA